MGTKQIVEGSVHLISLANISITLGGNMLLNYYCLSILIMLLCVFSNTDCSGILMFYLIKSYNIHSRTVG